MANYFYIFDKMEENYFPHEALNKQVLIDSRQLSMPKETIFFAFKGHFQDGHDFILPLYQQGVRWFVGEKKISQKLYKTCRFSLYTNRIMSENFALF